MLNIAEYQTRPRSLCDYLPWAALIAPGVILNKDGSFQRSIRYRGPDLESSTQSELVSLSAQINTILRRFGEGWVLYFEAERLPSKGYPTSAFPDQASFLVDEERRNAFLEEGRHFECRYYMTFQFLPPVEALNRAEQFLFEQDKNESQNEDVRSRYQDHLENFIKQTNRACDLFAAIFPEVLPLDDEQTLTYLHQTISTKKHMVQVPDIPACLDAFLCDCAFSGGIAPKLGGKHLRILTILGFPNVTYPGIFDDLNDLALSYRWMTRWLPLDKAKAESILKKQRRQWFAKRKSVGTLLREIIHNQDSPLIDSDAENKALDVDAALQELGAGDVSYGYVTTCLVIAEEDETIAEEQIRKIERVITAKGYVCINETLNAVEAWFGSLPGHAYANIRKPIIHSLNLAHMMPVSALWAGPENNAHLQGPPLLIARMKGSTPFRLSLHVQDVGHSLIVGPTGAGKSVLLSMLALQFRRYPGGRIIMFDKGRSARCAILAMGGSSFDLSPGGGLSFQPLALIDQERDRAIALDWLVKICINEAVSMTPELKTLLWSALCNLAEAPLEQRTLTGLALLVQSRILKHALHPYTLEGAFGALLDADQDRLTLSDVQHFEMEELLNSPQAILPVLSYLFLRLERQFDGRPTLLILDEAWVFLDHPLFASRIREWLKTLRKKNVSVIFATQSLADIAGSSIAPSLIESCPTRIFLPNTSALEPQSFEVYQHFGLNDRQIRIISEAIPKCDYYLQSAQGNRLFELGLGPVALALCGSSSPKDHRLMDEILKQAPQYFLPLILKAKNLHEAADLVRPHSSG